MTVQFTDAAPPAHATAAIRCVSGHHTTRQALDLCVPVYNEAHVLAANIAKLHRHLAARIPFTATITIVDNASTDETWRIACNLAAELPGVRAVHLDAKGRGRALRAAWCASEAEVVAYCDVDCSTDFAAFVPVVGPLLAGRADVATGSRLITGAHVVRGRKREVISRIYNRIVRVMLHSPLHDHQCGFKAVRADVARRLLPDVVNDEWFFDTELLVLAVRNGLRVAEVGVVWVDDPDSRVDILACAREDLRGIRRMRAAFAAGACELAAPLTVANSLLPAPMSEVAS